jgi:tetratricopeptide (TPR) repeat protein
MWLALVALIAQSVDFQADGIKALDAQKYGVAVDLFTKAVAADPKDYAAHFHLALAYSLLNKDAEAIQQYKSVLELKPDLYEAELNLGICLLRIKDAAAAIPYLNSASARKPGEYRPALYLGQALFEAGQFPEAEVAYTNALSIKGGSAAAELGLGQSLAREGKRADAEPHFRKAASLDPAYKDSLLQLASLYEEHQQPAEAIAIYREFPENPGAQERIGALLIQTGRAADAIPTLEAVVAKSPTSANRIALAQAYAQTNHLDKATPLAAQAVAAEPRDYELRLFYARLLRDQRKFSDAVPQFFAATQLQPQAAQPWNEMAALLVTSEQYPQAIAALDHVRALGAETSAHYYFRAIALDHMHQLKEALENYNRFLETSQGKSPDEEFKARQRSRIIQNELNKR